MERAKSGGNAARAVAGIVAILALAFAIAGCRPRAGLNPRYLPGMVAGSQHLFRKAKIAVPPTVSGLGHGQILIGKIYAADGTVEHQLDLADASKTFTPMLLQALADAGLAPVALDFEPIDGKPPAGIDFILDSFIEAIEVNKRFGGDETVHGQYFDMTARVAVTYQLRNRDGKVLYNGKIVGIEKEPPDPVGKEVFLPLETEPVESLSVALSRAIGKLMIEPKFREALPLIVPYVQPAK